ncbi:glycosyltransferase family 87 protein [Cognatiyoonia sp. IB215446]|uniref:glycosyltransferase family 87 protein n=1 Tax=Cognatiyoonia sp. IB215446 TaxID=3097355 RepID=UPI002A0D42F1|nr:glycosyltransferase family 87 protein [Cognatiyoonia sp. IB215446]MDX8349686.1 glycosyltransferase family 87 protein [Cognatiyoonia sp. IB215446]
MRRTVEIVLTAQQAAVFFAVANFLWVSAVLVLFAMRGVDVPGGATCVQRVVDFHALWGAGSLAFAGQPLSAFDHTALLAAFESCPRDGMFWLYPAPVLMILTPFGAMPFFVGYVAITALSLIFIALAARQFLQDKLIALALITFSPAWLPALMSGQLTLFWCAGLLFAISMLRQERNVAAGAIIGFLTLKPTLGLLIPVILLAERRYTTILAAIVTTAMLHFSATAYYGFEYIALWMDVSFFESAVERSAVALNRSLASFGSFATLFGVPDHFSTQANAIAFLVLAIVLFGVWRRHGVQSDLAVAALFAAIPLSAPYLWHYDAALSAVAALFIYLARPASPPIHFWMLLALFWFGPGIPVINQIIFQAQWVYPTSVLSPILMVAFVFSLRQLRNATTTAQNRKAV